MKALFVIGYIASGKSTYVNSIKKEDDLIIELGQVVREITHEEKRVFDNGLDDAIYDYCRDLIGESVDQISRVIFVAPRSVELMDKLTKMIDDYDIVYLFTPYRIRKMRFDESKRAKDEGITYMEALRKDASIGMEKLVTGLCHSLWGPYTSVANYTEQEYKRANKLLWGIK